MNNDFQMENILIQYIRLISRTHENINNTIRTMEDQTNDLSRMMFEYLNQRRNNRQENIRQNNIIPSRPAEQRRSAPLRTTSFFSDPTPSETNQSTSNSLLNPPRAAPIIPPPPPPPPIFQFRAGTGSTTNNETTPNTTSNAPSNSTTNTSSNTTPIPPPTTTNDSIFNRGRISRRFTRNVSTSPIRRNNILTTPLISTRRNRRRRRNFITSLPGILSGEDTSVGQDILTATMNDSPVRIRPSPSQIRRATRLTVFRNITHDEGTICPIDREILNDDDNVLQIIHCGHYFREENLRRHFTMSTRCPLCRFDIRDYIENYSEPRDSTSLFSSRNRTHELPPIDIENPFSRRPGINFNPTQQTTDELQAISNALNNLDNSGNIISVEYTFSLASLDNNTNNNSTETDDTESNREHFD